MTDYRIEIQASNADGTIWQTMHVEYAPGQVPVEGCEPVSAFALTSGEAPVVAGQVWEPFDATPAGVGGIPHIMYRAYRRIPAEEIAEDTAQDQNIAEGDNWRVRVYRGDADTHLAEAGPGVVSLTQLVSRLTRLSVLPPVERAIESAALADEARSVMARIRRAAVYEATRSESWADVAGRLGVSAAAVNQLITQHRR